jgi:hypothetical protein
MLQRKNYSLFVLFSDVIIFVDVINDEGEGRGMRQHVLYPCTTCADKGETQIGCRLEHDVSPPTTDLYKPVPPPFAVPFPSQQDLVISNLAFA